MLLRGSQLVFVRWLIGPILSFITRVLFLRLAD